MGNCDRMLLCVGASLVGSVGRRPAAWTPVWAGASVAGTGPGVRVLRPDTLLRVPTYARQTLENIVVVCDFFHLIAGCQNL